MSAVEHGTYGGYQQHTIRGDLPACIPCKTASTAYQRAYRATPRGRANRLAAVKARESALKALSHAHPDEYRALYADARGGAA